MNTKDTIKKLISIAQKQQTIIEKLAQLVPEDTNNVKSYLDTALATAVGNAQAASEFHSVLQPSTEGGWVYTMYFNPPLKNDIKQKILNNIEAYMKANKPELLGKVTLKFA